MRLCFVAVCLATSGCAAAADPLPEISAAESGERTLDEALMQRYFFYVPQDSARPAPRQPLPQAAWRITRSINLDAPRAMEALKGKNPAHFEKVQAILDAASQLPIDTIARHLRVRYDARSVGLSPIIKTSFPAQSELSFILDDTYYRKTIRLEVAPVITPAAPYKPR